MRILLSCLQSPPERRHPIPAHGFWRHYLANGLAEAGHEVIELGELDWAEGIVPKPDREQAAWKDRAWSQTLAAVKSLLDGRGLDLCLFYLYPEQIDTGAISELRRLGVPCVNFFCDNVREFARLPKEFAPFDLHWVPEHKALPLYARAGLPHLCAPMPCWVPPEQRRLPEIEAPLVRFIGSSDGLRQQLLSEVSKKQLPLEILGTGWLPDSTGIGTPLPVDTPARHMPTLGDRLGHWIRLVERQGLAAAARRLTGRLRPATPVPDLSAHARPPAAATDYGELLRGCAVTLGINRYPSLRFPEHRPDTYSRLRDIEAPMLGACLLTEWTEGLDELYLTGTEIEVYRDAAELCEKARALLADPERRQALRKAALQRAHREHSIPCTLAKIATRLGIVNQP